MESTLILEVDPAGPTNKILGLFGEPQIIGGKQVIILSCDKIDFSGPLVEVQLANPKEWMGLTVWIPRNNIICAVGGFNNREIGFADFLSKK